jgi:acetyl esterase
MELDRELEPWVSRMPRFDFGDVAGSRASLESFLDEAPQRIPDGVEAIDASVPGRGSGPSVPVRIYRSGDTRPTAALLWTHGGGFVMGSARMDHALCGAMAAKAGIAVVSVDYRLAPEHPYPSALDDCWAALRWVAEGPRELGIHVPRLAVGGQSAGGCLAAATALRARDDGGPALDLQVLIEPVLDARLDTSSMRRGDDTPVWDRQNAMMSWRHYLGGREATPHASPALARDLAGLPAAYVRTNEVDPLRDEGLEYARRLLAAGVPVEAHTFIGTFHGSDSIGHAEVTKRARGELMAVLRHHLGGRPPGAPLG